MKFANKQIDPEYFINVYVSYKNLSLFLFFIKKNKFDAKNRETMLFLIKDFHSLKSYFNSFRFK